MMGRKERQIQLVIVDIGDLVPDNHLLKQIDRQVNFDFIYERVKNLYSDKGRTSIDPVIMFKMLLIGYLYGIKSERKLEEEINLNIGYRWFCGLEIYDKVPDHSTFSQNRKRRFKDSSIFEEIFVEIVKQCLEKGLVDGENIVSDGTFVPANVAFNKKIEKDDVIFKSTVDYLQELDKELSYMNGYVKSEGKYENKRVLTNKTDSECGYVNRGNKKGFGYLGQVSVDTKNGIITGVDVYPANRKEL